MLPNASSNVPSDIRGEAALTIKRRLIQGGLVFTQRRWPQMVCEELGELRPSSSGWGSQCQELLLLLWWKRQRQKACKAQFSGESPAVSPEGSKVRHKTKQQFLSPTYLHTIVLHTAEPVQWKIMLRFLKGFCKTKNIGSHFLFRLVTSHTIMKSRS